MPRRHSLSSLIARWRDSRARKARPMILSTLKRDRSARECARDNLHARTRGRESSFAQTAARALLSSLARSKKGVREPHRWIGRAQNLALRASRRARERRYRGAPSRSRADAARANERLATVKCNRCAPDCENCDEEGTRSRAGGGEGGEKGVRRCNT